MVLVSFEKGCCLLKKGLGILLHLIHELGHYRERPLIFYVMWSPVATVELGAERLKVWLQSKEFRAGLGLLSGASGQLEHCVTIPRCAGFHLDTDQ